MMLLQSCCKEEPEDVLPPENDPPVEADAWEIQDRVFYEVNLRAFSANGDLHETFQAVMSIYSEREVARHGDLSDDSNASVVSFVKYDGGEQLWVAGELVRRVDR